MFYVAIGVYIASRLIPILHYSTRDPQKAIARKIGSHKLHKHPYSNHAVELIISTFLWVYSAIHYIWELTTYIYICPSTLMN